MLHKKFSVGDNLLNFRSFPFVDISVGGVKNCSLKNRVTPSVRTACSAHVIYAPGATHHRTCHIQSSSENRFARARCEWLEERRESGDLNDGQIWRGMVAEGFAGSEPLVRDEVARWRKAGAAPVTALTRLPLASGVSRWLIPWTIIRATENYVTRLIGLMREKELQLKITQQLALDFYRLLKTKNRQELSNWFTRVSESGSVKLQRVAAGM